MANEQNGNQVVYDAKTLKSLKSDGKIRIEIKVSVDISCVSRYAHVTMSETVRNILNMFAVVDEDKVPYQSLKNLRGDLVSETKERFRVKRSLHEQINRIGTNDSPGMKDYLIGELFCDTDRTEFDIWVTPEQTQKYAQFVYSVVQAAINTIVQSHVNMTFIME